MDESGHGAPRPAINRRDRGLKRLAASLYDFDAAGSHA